MKLVITCSFVTDSQLNHDAGGGQVTSASDYFIALIAPIAMNLNSEALRSRKEHISFDHLDRKESCTLFT